MKPRSASQDFTATHDAAQDLLADAGTFMRETGALQRMTVYCFILALRRLLPAEGFLVGALRSDGSRVVRFRAILPDRLRRRDKFHQKMEFKLLFESLNNRAITRRIELSQCGPYLEFSAEVEPCA